MSCCNTYTDIGCYDFCSSIDLGYEAVQSGTHTLEVGFLPGTYQSIDLGSLSISDDLTIPANSLNESKEHYIKVKQPDDTYYEFSTGIYCIRLISKISL